MKKKLWCVLCIMICMMMIAACGQKKNPEKKKSEKAEQEETEFKDRESLKLSLFTVYYPKAWNYDKENMKKEEEYSYVRFFDGDTADGSENVISIEATKEDSYTYRKSLIAFGVDLEAYAEGKMDTVTIGNAEYTAMPESNSIEKTYMYRYEQSGTSYDIRVKGQEIDDSDKELLEGIVLKLEDEGNKDAPWPWEGEPVEPVLAEQMVGSYTIVPKYIPFKEAQGVMQIMDHQFVKQGNQVFHLLENKLDTYEYSESGLKFVSSMELDDDCEYLSGDNSGMLYLSPGIGDVIGVKDGKKAMQTTVDGYLNMHPSGEWGISFWVNSDVFVMPSVSEPFGIAPLEAMQCGTPSIISKQSGCGEILDKVIKTDYWDIHAMADAIYSLCTNPALFQYLQEEGRKEVDGITWEKVGLRIRALYEDVLRNYGK